MLALMTVPALGQAKGKKPDPFAELPETKMIMVEQQLTLATVGPIHGSNEEQREPEDSPSRARKFWGAISYG